MEGGLWENACVTGLWWIVIQERGWSGFRDSSMKAAWNTTKLSRVGGGGVVNLEEILKMVPPYRKFETVLAT